MRFTVDALLDRGVPGRADLRLDGAPHGLRRRPLRPLPARADAHLPGRARVLATTRSPAGWRCGSYERAAKPKLAVWKFASCDGCQLIAPRLEDELLALADAVEIAYFLEATSAIVDGPVRPVARRGLDHDAARRRADPGGRARLAARWSRSAPARPRAGSRRCGTSPTSTSSSPPSTPRPSTSRRSTTSTPISAHVPVDFELHGCPIDKRQLLEVVTAFLHGRKPGIPSTSVCIECKSAATCA